MKQDFPELEKAIKKAPVFEIAHPTLGKYQFRVFDFGERGTWLSPKLIKEIVEGLSSSIKKNFSDFDYIVAAEPNGPFWGVAVAYKLNKPLNVIRSSPTYRKGEIKISREASYYRDVIYLNHFKSQDKVLILEDVVSTGKTLDIIIGTLISLKVKVVGVQTILAKSNDYKKIEKKYSVRIKFLQERNFPTWV